MRSGDEPSHARSPLRLRLTLALFGLLCWSAGAVAFSLARAALPAAACAVGACVAILNVAVVAQRIRSGPHWQPGPLVPPFSPLVPVPVERGRGPVRSRAPHGVRVHRYLLLMGTALLLMLVDWSWLWRVSMPAAMGVSLVVMLMLPVAAVVANAGSLTPRESRSTTHRVTQLPGPRAALEGVTLGGRSRAAGAVRILRGRWFGRRRSRQIPGG